MVSYEFLFVPCNSRFSYVNDASPAELSIGEKFRLVNVTTFSLDKIKYPGLICFCFHSAVNRKLEISGIFHWINHILNQYTFNITFTDAFSITLYRGCLH